VLPEMVAQAIKAPIPARVAMQPNRHSRRLWVAQLLSSSALLDTDLVCMVNILVGYRSL
jgi:hypothetical protein